MEKRLLLVLCGILLAVTQLFAQSQTITGTVTAKEDGLPLPGVTVKVKGTTTGTQTGINGKFSLNAPPNAILSFSFIGYTTLDVPVGGKSQLNVVLVASSKGLNEVIVTALGISREQKSLGYAAQAVKGDDLTVTKQSDLNTALAGKIAGVQVLGGSGAKFGTSTIRIRGVNALQGGNPIYVVNGVITDPNGVNNDDIESLTVLKGPAATALYGQRASEGAVVIQLKKGVDKGIGISFNQSTTFEKVYQLPNYQNEYGGGTSIKWNTYTYDPGSSPASNANFNGVKYYDYGVDESWGPKMDGTLYAPWYFWDPSNPGYGKLVPFVPQPNNVRDFYRTGVTYNTNAAFSKAADNYNFRVSYTNIDRTGITPNSDQKRNNVSLNGELKLTKKLTVSANVNFSQINSSNIPDEGYGTQTAGSFSQWFHRDVDMSKLKNYRRADGTFTSWNITSPDDLTPHYWDNPYTEVYENTSKSNSNRVYGNLTATYQFTKDLSVSLIAREDLLNRDDNNRTASGTLNLDQYTQNQYTYKENNYVGNVTYNHLFGDLSVKAGVYAESRQDRYLFTGGNTNGGLAIPDLYTLGNSSNAPTAISFNGLSRVNSYYGYTSFGYKNFLYLDFNARNDRSSTLPVNNNSYWYGGLSTSFVFTELMPKNDIFTFGKLRLSAAKLGSDAGLYQIYQTYNLGTNPYGTSPTQTVPNALPNANLKPALSTSYEVGTELHFIQDRIKFDFNYYTRTQKDQILSLPINGTSGYSSAVVNAGSIRNNGIEISLGGTPVKSKDFIWNVDFNIAFNRNKILSLYPGTNTLPVAPDNKPTYDSSGGNNPAGATGFGFVGSPSFGVNGVVGGSYGQIIGSGFIRDAHGNIVVDANGMPTWSSTVNLGSMLPSYTGGFTNSFNYKGFTLAFSLDFQKGGKFVSVTQQNLNGSGLGAETVGNNAKGNPVRNAVADGGGTLVAGVHADGTPNTTYVETRSLYEQVYSQIWEKWTYDASYVKLREVSIGYTFSKKMLGKTPFQSAYFGITSQNPWMIYSKVKGVDPSQLQTSFYEGGQLPNTRNLGFNLKLTF
ncbi:SusC/RagA family TonB-linked outer membrane protein [Mucilaginibacter sp. SG564]|uniref:SusC/RagA family TonB-linked outer membrane protein n=1 Tax=unclassified Mucilaginibacter TaxID=2617802 RepID=UPI0015560AE2|nr:SusC/RagA family TonB-linked outer membrane protein [Mucilaginibacter sp. SG564]NOW97048.1 TonB-linked SusC/RagA family outer membrane protein [Mucilaginibacter sp. SG564]